MPDFSAYSLVFAILLLAGMAALARQRDFPYRVEGLLSGAVCLVFLLACRVGAFSMVTAAIDRTWSSPLDIFVYRAVYGFLFIAWFLRFYGCILLFALMRTVAPRLKIGDLRPTWLGLAVAAGYVLLQVLLAIGVYRTLPQGPGIAP